ncbi:hypothetical protein PLICRDRAFT_41022 [Plicaturopsis crispa FD-325 SS-3]|nr:hypothetical protein PLICRDRAFT_41022 [Plicaturopsis crispa FD-325 SS-3]
MENTATSSEDEVSDVHSDLLCNHNLRTDLTSALEGAYAYSSYLPKAPDPEIHIAGKGRVMLPLDASFAEKLITRVSMEKFWSLQTKYSNQGLTHWEAGADEVTFGNAAWAEYVHGVARTVSAALGIAQSVSTPKCVFRKLIVQKEGSRYPVPKVPKEPGPENTFAKIVIALPSRYTGGRLEVSQPSSSPQILDMGPGSQSAASLLSWHVDSAPTMKPVTSGYRLALVYDLRHTHPCPYDSIHAVRALYGVLQRWGASEYAEEADEVKMVAYMLKHNYSSANSVRRMEPADARKVQLAKAVCAKTGFKAFLVELETRIYGHGYPERNDDDEYLDYATDEDEDGDAHPPKPNPSKNTSTDFWDCLDPTTGLDVDSHSVADIDRNPIPHLSIDVESKQIIPDGFYKLGEPDDEEVDQDSGGWRFDHHRTALVFLPAEYEISYLLSRGGEEYTLSLLKAVTAARSSAEEALVDKVLGSLGPKHIAAACAIADISITWNDVSLWEKAVNAGGESISFAGLGHPRLLKAWKQFSFERVRPAFERVLTRRESMTEGFTFLDTVVNAITRVDGDRDTVTGWCKAQTSHVLTSDPKPTKKDVAYFVEAAQSGRIAFISDIVLPQVVKVSSIYNFWAMLAESLESERDTIVTPGDSKRLADFEKVMEKCLRGAILQWDASVFDYRGQEESPKASKLVAHVMEIVDLCISAGHRNTCGALFNKIISSPSLKEDVPTAFTTVYVPVVNGLRKALKDHEIDMQTEPFGLFFRILVGLHLHHVLGAKPTENTKVRKIGCGCAECNKLDHFMADTSMSRGRVPVPKEQRAHIEKRISDAADVISLVAPRTRNANAKSVTVAKVQQHAEWKKRHTRAKQFLASIAPGDTELAKLMGARYADVEAALDGVLYPLDASKANTPDVAGVETGSKRKR